MVVSATSDGRYAPENGRYAPQSARLLRCREMSRWAINGREQAQHMLCDDLVGRARSTW